MSVPEPDKDGVRRYGAQNQWKEDQTKCIYEVWGNDRWPTANQCNRKRGHGPDGLYCKQHDPAAIEARREESHKRWQQQFERDQRPRLKLQAYEKALRDIVDGHNDPGARAAEALKEFE